MRRVVKVAAALLLVLAIVLVARAARTAPRRPSAAASAPVPGEGERTAALLAQALRFRTISHSDPAEDDAAQLQGLHAFLRASFPLVHAQLQVEEIGAGALLFTWAGKDAQLAPLLLLGHQDVVPVEAATESKWTVPPFEGRIEGGFVWGRGALDDKVSVIALLQAAELLLAQGFVPQRTVLLAFGNDEEVSGHGATAVATLLRARGVKPLFILDEGQAVTHDLVPGVQRPMALIGVAEKGYLSLELTAQAEGGHSSMPPAHTAAGLLGAALARLEANPPSPRMTEGVRREFEAMAPEMPFGLRLLAANLWLFSPVLARALTSKPGTAAMVRTTLAPTILRAGEKDNVLPAQARAVVNLRLLPGDSVALATERVTGVVSDPRVTIRPYGAFQSEPSPESSVDGPGFALVARSVLATFPEAAVAPSLVLGGTDARHYQRLLGIDTYRFAPIRMHPADLPRLHGVDERLAVDNLGEAVRFYRTLIEDGAGK